MASRTYLFCLVFLAGLVSVCFGQEAEVASDETVVEIVKVALPAFPYVAEITADNVYIRSGPGTNYYSCGKLHKGNEVTVVASKYSWSHIVPPTGSFSWISKQYVKIDSENPGVGIVFPRAQNNDFAGLTWMRRSFWSTQP